MGFSINTNVGAFVALQQLNKTTSQLEVTQLRITTGLRVNGPKDDASNFAIATRLRGDIKGIESVKIALATGDSIVNVAIQAGKSIADLLTDMKAKVVQANQAGLDSASRTALNNDFTSLRDQLTTIVVSAEFNNTSLITSGAGNLTVLSTVDGSTITVSAQAMGCVSKVVEIGFGASPSGLSFAAVRPRGQGFRRRLADRGFPIHRLCASGFGRKRGAPRGASALFRDTAARSVF